jgi:HlyD family secretion protein
MMVLNGGRVMRKRFACLLVLLIVFLFVLSGCSSKGGDAGDPDPIPVRLAKVNLGPVSENITFSGEVSAGSEVQVVPKTAGRIARVTVSVGQEVHKGDLLVELEAQELSVGLRQAEAAAEMARANLKNVQSGGALAQLKATVQQAEANYNNVKNNLERMEALYLEGAISLQALEGSRLQHVVAESQANLAKEQLAIFERGEGQVEILQAQVKQAEAGLEMARLNYNNARITAPVDGVVAMVNAEVGNMASPGMPMATIVDMEGVIVKARLTEQTVGMVFPGMVVEVEVTGLGATFAGEVREVAPSSQTGTKSFLVNVKLLDAAGVKPGMFARLKIDVASSENAVLAPRAAVLERDDEHYVFTVVDGKAVRRVVTVGLKDEQYVEVLSGLSAGEEIVSAGQHFLRNGSMVMVTEGDA